MSDRSPKAPTLYPNHAGNLQTPPPQRPQIYFWGGVSEISLWIIVSFHQPNKKQEHQKSESSQPSSSTIWGSLIRNHPFVIRVRWRLTSARWMTSIGTSKHSTNISHATMDHWPCLGTRQLFVVIFSYMKNFKRPQWVYHVYCNMLYSYTYIMFIHNIEV